jgi:hypothetical protein
VTFGRTFLLAALAAILVPRAQAYDSSGHSAVGKIAYVLLTPAAEAEVKAILGDVSLGTAAVWPDCVKGVTKDYVYQHNQWTSPECAGLETPDEQARMESYVRRNDKQCGWKESDGNETCHKQYHYADVAIEHEAYGHYEGTSDHDVVATINAAYAVLRGKPSPAPYAFADRREALMVLAHVLGDIHQPMHVGAVYLDEQARPVDPDQPANAHAHHTAGGNLIGSGKVNLHTDWDTVPRDFTDPTSADFEAMLAAARRQPPTPGDPRTWSTTWATGTLHEARRAFEHMSFSKNPNGDKPPYVAVYENREAYDAGRVATQRRLIATAGARLAQILNSAFAP